MVTRGAALEPIDLDELPDFGAPWKEGENGRFHSFFDFCRRSDFQRVNKRVLEGLIRVGAFDSTGARRAQLAAVMELALEDAAGFQRERERGQTSIFGGALDGQLGDADPAALPLPEVPEWDQVQRVQYERELTGFYITAHPLESYASTIAKFATTTTQGLAEPPPQCRRQPPIQRDSKKPGWTDPSRRCKHRPAKTS